MRVFVAIDEALDAGLVVETVRCDPKGCGDGFVATMRTISRVGVAETMLV